MGVPISDRITTVAQGDVFATGDGNRQALGLHAVNSTLERNQIPLDRRKETYEATGANATPKPFFVSVRVGSVVTLYWLKNEPGTATTTDSDWEAFTANPAEVFEGFFNPATATFTDGTGVKGHYYIANVAGTYNAGSGAITYALYDKALHDGTSYKKVGTSSAIADWNTMINKPTTFPPTAHTHPISEVTGLTGELANKVDYNVVFNDINDTPAEIPTSHAVANYTYSKGEVDDRLSNLVTYGIKYTWDTLAEQNTQTGQLAGYLGLRTDEQKVYIWNGTAWEFFFTLEQGGHTIVNSSDVSQPQRGKLKFVGATVTDSLATDTTTVTITGGVSSVNGQTGIVTLDTDDISEVGSPTNKWFTESRVRASLLTGLSLASSTIISATDSVLSALGRLQAQITANIARFQNSMTVDGTGLKFSSTDAVNAMANDISLVATNTGFTRTDDSFSLYKFDDNTLGITASQYGVIFSNYFTTPPFAPSDAVKHLTARTVALSTVGVIPVNTQTVKYVGWAMPSDTIVFSDTPYIQSKTICQLGLIYVKNVSGVYSFIDTVRTTQTIPDISAYNNLQTTAFGTIANVVVNHNASGMTMQNTSGSVKGISVNWGGSNTDEKIIAASATTSFIYLNPGLANSVAPLPAFGTTLNPTQYWNGSAMTTLSAGNSSQVMRVMVSIRGTIIVQPGEASYNSLTLAKDNVLTQTYTNIIPKDTFVEIGRIAVRRDASNLADTNDAVFYTSGGGNGGGGGGGAATFTTITGSPYDNTALAAELNNRAQALLTGYTIGANTSVLTTDTISQGIGKLEKKANDNASSIATNTTAIAAKLPIAPVVTTGTALTFTTDTIYGSEATPETGNITASTTGAIVGVTNLIIHNSGTAPTFDSKFYKLSGSGTYVLSVKNYIYCTYLSSTRIIYSINQ